jgi:hypothetical protein
MADESEREEKKTMTMVSKSGTARGFVVRRWNGGSCGCQRCNNNNYSTHNHGWIGAGRMQIYVAWIGVDMWPGVGASANI